MLLITANLLMCYTVRLVASSVLSIVLVTGAAALDVEWLRLLLGSVQSLIAVVVLARIVFAGLSYGIALKFYLRKA